jgi:hypothetical protein
MRALMRKKGEISMSIVRVIEVLAQSDKGWEDAAHQALKECAGYTFHPPAFSANSGPGGRPTVIVVQPVQYRERHHLP